MLKFLIKHEKSNEYSHCHSSKNVNIQVQGVKKQEETADLKFKPQGQTPKSILPEPVQPRLLETYKTIWVKISFKQMQGTRADFCFG